MLPAELDRASCRASSPMPKSKYVLAPSARMNGTAPHDSTLLITVGTTEQPLVRRQRRLGAHDAALAFQAIEKSRLLAAHVGAGTRADLDIENLARASDIDTEQPGLAGDADRAVERDDGVRILGADVDEALGGAHRQAGNGHALDQDEWIAFHQHAVGKGAAVALHRRCRRCISARPRCRAPSSI
jgi:hypothetical protein